MQEEVKFKVYILGEGEERKALERQQHELRLDDVVSMPGFIANPYSILKNMQLLVCPSIAEGYSLVIAEALYLGVPAPAQSPSSRSKRQLPARRYIQFGRGQMGVRHPPDDWRP